MLLKSKDDLLMLATLVANHHRPAIPVAPYHHSQSVGSLRHRGTPPWIKVYRNLLSNPEWVGLTDAEKGQLVSIWILAADKGGVVPDNPSVIQKMCMLDSPPDLDKFGALGFLADGDDKEPELKQSKKDEGKIYFIKLQGSVKIGYSKNPWARLSQLKTGMPHEPELLGQ